MIAPRVGDIWSATGPSGQGLKPIESCFLIMSIDIDVRVMQYRHDERAWLMEGLFITRLPPDGTEPYLDTLWMNPGNITRWRLIQRVGH